MTSMELREIEFSKSLRGYKKEEVDALLGELAGLLEQYEAQEKKYEEEERTRRER